MAELAKDFTLPKPKFRVTRDQGANKNAVKFFNYWASIPEKQRDLVEVRVYRLWPICDLKIVDPKAPVQWEMFRGEIPFEPGAYENAFLHRYGSGEWRCILGETGVTGAVAETYFSVIDLDNYAPKIDLRTLIRGNFKNEAYVKWVERQPGIEVPWKTEKDALKEAEKEEEMNIASTLTEAFVRRNEKLEEQVEALKESVVDGATSASGAEAEAQTEAIKIVSEGSREAIKIMAEQAKQQHSGPPILEIVDRITAATNRPDSTLQVISLVMDNQAKAVSAVQEMHRQTLEFMREQREPTQTAEAPRDTLDQFLEQADKMKRLTEFFGAGNRRNSPEPLQSVASGPSYVEKFFDKLAANPPMLITGLVLVTNLVQSVLGRGRPVDQVLQEAGKAAGEVAAAPQAAPAPPAPPQPNPAEEQQRRLDAFLQLIQPLFLAHYFDEQQIGLNGASFAATLTTMTQAGNGMTFVPGGTITDTGRQQLALIQQGGLENFDRIIRNYQPIWSMVGGNMPKYTRFLRDLFNYQEETPATNSHQTATTVAAPN